MAIDDTRVLPEDSAGSDPERAAAHETQHPTLPGQSSDRARAEVPPALAVQVGHHFGPYYIHRLLGRGGMGEVYEAEHLETGRTVALKVLTGGVASVDRARFLREGRLAASISHPNTVYVFGTEELSGAPAISMELVRGGTLQDRVARGGPMEPPKAVDAILMAIDGLEAAAARGILHRDVKPSNCFVETGEIVKVGDFGLSTSTAARSDTQLTIAGSILGTPAFAAPEQLRGEPLDSRADIYSVGATLYFLLTGRAPFEEDGMVKMVAAVLQAQPVPPASLRPGLPRGLDAVVLRCLRKDRAQRYGDYADLREALQPFGTTAPRPATLGLRLLAGAIDSGITSLFILSYSFFVIGVGRRSVSAAQAMLGSVPLYAASLLYFALPEGWWGASAGKALMRLRVVGPDRGAPGVRRTLARSGITEVAPLVPWLLVAILRPEAEISTLATTAPWVYWSAVLGSAAMTWALFLTVRRTNGYAALHDLASGTRVVERAAMRGRARQQFVLEPSSTSPPAGRRLGPYLVPDADRSAFSVVVAGYDEGLRRRVWIQLSPPAPVAPARRALGRAGRLRWLNGRRAPTESWDAWEAPEGRALLDLLGRRQPWLRVRGWLLDLAEELEAGERDGTQPEHLSLDRVWIDGGDRAKLLEFAAPRDPRLAGPELGAEVSTRSLSPRDLLLVVARSGLSGSPVDPRSAWAPAPDLPIHARDLLLGLVREGGSIAGAAAALRELRGRASDVTRARRLAHLALCGILPFAFWVSAIVTLAILQQSAQAYPGIGPLRRGVQRLEWLREACPAPERSRAAVCDELAAMQTYLAAGYRPLLEDDIVWESAYVRFRMSARQRELAEQVILGRAAPSVGEAQAAKERLKDWLRQQQSDKTLLSFTTIVTTLVFLLVCAAVLGILSAVAFRGGGALRLLGIAVAGPDGAHASRVRCLWRAVIAWSPLLGIVLAFELMRLAGRRPGWAVDVVEALGLLIFLGGCVAALVRPARGIQDRLAGTWLVPK